MRAFAEARGALVLATALRARADALPRELRVAALAWLPLAGALVGLFAALVARVLEPVAPVVAALGAVAVLRVLAPVAPRALVAVVAALEFGAVLALPAGGRTVPLILAPMLARWAVVVQCHGGAPAAGTADSLAGRARFREFGWASLVAIGGSLVTLDALGLLAVLASALVTLGLRAAAYRRAGGIGDRDLARTEHLVEAAVLTVLAAVALLARS